MALWPSCGVQNSSIVNEVSEIASSQRQRKSRVADGSMRGSVRGSIAAKQRGSSVGSPRKSQQLDRVSRTEARGDRKSLKEKQGRSRLEKTDEATKDAAGASE